MGLSREWLSLVRQIPIIIIVALASCSVTAPTHYDSVDELLRWHNICIVPFDLGLKLKSEGESRS